MRIGMRALLVFLVTLLGAAGCDHASKQLAISTLAHAGSVSVAGDTLRLQLSSNPGAFLSLGAGLPEAVRELLFVGILPLLVLWFCVYLLRAGATSLPFLVGLGLVAGGGLANWLDRLLHGGAVTDFIALSVGPLRTGIFNLADVAVVAGMALLVLLAGARPRPAGGRA